MMQGTLSIGILSFLMLIDTALAAEPTFANLQSMCRNKTDPSQQGYCLGFVEAIALRIARDDKTCEFLRQYIDQANADLALPDLVADINPSGYSKKAIEAVEKFLYNRGCT
ncbi:hypothetical protein [Pararhizobium sp. PWRC1-1]|uniref:hypothetical protein n=1 Tax=Pararhizobium sp. PWRC1-1 TaxID=2804566 RepID=UPI003CE8610E